MKIRKFIPMTLVLSTALLLSACANRGVEQFATDYDNYQLGIGETLNPRQKADLYEAIIAADLAAHKGDHLAAMSYYLYAAELSKEQVLIDKSIDAARAADDILGLEQAATIWLEIAPNHPQALKIALEAQLSMGNVDKATETAAQLMAMEPQSEARFSLLTDQILGQSPAVGYRLLRNLYPSYPKEPAISAAQAQLIFSFSVNSNKPEENLTTALQASETALSLDKYYIPAIKLRSHILYQLRRDQEAVKYLMILQHQKPKSRPISQMLGELLYDIRNYKASANHFTGWLIDHPDDLQAKYYQAASYYALGQFHLSLASFQQLVDSGYESQNVAFYCGESARKVGELTLAESCFARVSEGKFHVQAKVKQAALIAERGETETALSLIKSQQAADQDEEIQFINAEINILNRYFSEEQAKIALNRALQQYPDNLSLILKKIKLYKLLDKPDELYQLLTQARELIEPGDRLHRFNLAAAALLRNNEHYQLAIDWLNQALVKTPDDKDLLYTRALYKEPLGLYKEMIKDFKYLLELFPDDLNIKNALGYTLVDMEQELAYAEQLIESAFQGLPENPAVIDSKGWLAYRKGDLELAEQFLEQAFKMAPSPEGAAHLGEVYWQKGKQDVAMTVWRKGLEIDDDNKVLRETLQRLNVDLE